MTEAEMRIPVFTVLKNGAILKNIFIVNRPPGEDGEGEGEGEGGEEVLTVGRHPDCSIVLSHPSVSRFHLQIYSNPFSQKLSIMDLSSVHGTWVSDKKIEPGARVMLTEGDILRVGVSSRVYRLHWVPLSQAYDLDRSFVSASDVSLVEEMEEERTAAGEGKEVEAYQDNKTPEIECEELVKFNDPSDNSRKEHSLFGRQEVAETAEDGGLPNIIEYDEVEKSTDLFREVEKENLIEYDEVERSTDLFSEVEKENLMIAKGEVIEAFQDERSLGIEDPSSGEGKMGIYQDMLTEVQEIHSLDPILGEMGSLTFTENSELPANCETSTALIMSEDTGSSIFKEDEASQSPSDADPNQIENLIACKLLASSSVSLSLPMVDQSQTDNPKLDDEQSGRKRSENEALESFIISETSEIVESRWSSGKGDIDGGKLSHFSALCLLESALSSPKVILAEKASPQKKVEENLMSQQLLFSEPELPSENENSGVNLTQNCEGIDQLEREDILSLDLVKPARKPFNSSLSEQSILSEVTCRYVMKENQPSRSPLGRKTQSQKENLEGPNSSTKSITCSIWSRRGKPSTALQLQTASNRRKSKSAAFNSENGKNCEESIVEKASNGNLFADSDGEEIFTPDKENLTPNTRKLKFLKEIGEVGALHSKPLKGSSSKVSFSPTIFPTGAMFRSSDQENHTPMKEIFTPKNLLKSGKASGDSFSFNSYPDDDIFHSSDKENQTPKFQREHGRVKSSSRGRSRLVKQISGAKGRERMPFQSLHINSEMGSQSSGLGALTSSSSVEFAGDMGKKSKSVDERKRSWIMVADTTSFLDKESTKMLQLLQGLRGTQLFIPRTVLRELDTLKRQRSLFRRSTDVCSVLEWVENTMVNSKWWIHIQSSAEEGWAIAPTPRASPFSFSEASDNFPMFTNNSVRFSFSGNSSVEIVSPTEEDRILEYALLVRKRNIDAQLVLLSNDVSLKIKAMAEGLLCETPQEFRESLVNPFSKRFMWAESSPRGLTWSLSDDVVLKEKYFQHPLKKFSRGDDAKGLKLILRHNSHYGQVKQFS